MNFQRWVLLVAFVSWIGATWNVSAGGPTRTAGSGEVVSADVRVDLVRILEPPFSQGVFYYGFGVINDGPDSSTQVEFIDTIPAGLVFDSLRIETSRGDLPHQTPEPGESGEITVQIDVIEPGDVVIIEVCLRAIAEPGERVTNTARAAVLGTYDPDEGNNSLDVSNTVPIPPVVYDVKSFRTSDGSLRIRITGANFHPPFPGGPFLFIGDDYETWLTYKVQGSLRIKLRGDRLKERFPKGVAVPIRIINVDGGEILISFAR